MAKPHSKTDRTDQLGTASEPAQPVGQTPGGNQKMTTSQPTDTSSNKVAAPHGPEGTYGEFVAPDLSTYPDITPPEGAVNGEDNHTSNSDPEIADAQPAEDGQDDWGFKPQKSSFTKETKIGLCLAMILVVGFAAVVYKKMNEHNLNKVIAGEQTEFPETENPTGEPTGLPAPPDVSLAQGEPTPVDLTSVDLTQGEPTPVDLTQGEPTPAIEEPTFVETTPKQEAVAQPFLTPEPEQQTPPTEVAEAPPLDLSAPSQGTPLQNAPGQETPQPFLFPEEAPKQAATQQPATPEPAGNPFAEPAQTTTVTQTSTEEPTIISFDEVPEPAAPVTTQQAPPLELTPTEPLPKPQPVQQASGNPFAEAPVNAAPQEPQTSLPLDLGALEEPQPVAPVETTQTPAQPEPSANPFAEPVQTTTQAEPQTAQPLELPPATEPLPEPVPLNLNTAQQETVPATPALLTEQKTEQKPGEPTAVKPVSQEQMLGGFEAVSSEATTAESTTVVLPEVTEPEPAKQVAQSGGSPFVPFPEEPQQFEGKPVQQKTPEPIAKEPAQEFPPIEQFPTTQVPATQAQTQQAEQFPPATGQQPAQSTASAGTTAAPDAWYTVQAGDNYWRISQKQYGHPYFYQALELHNQKRIPDPRKIRPGMKVMTPTPQILIEKYAAVIPRELRGNAVTRKVAPQQNQRSPGALGNYGFGFDSNGKPVYTIGPEDTLSDIAHKHLGRASRWIQIYEMNRENLKNPDRLQVGETIRLPADASRVVRSSNGGIIRQ